MQTIDELEKALDCILPDYLPSITKV